MTAADRALIIAAVITVLVSAAVIFFHPFMAAKQILVWKNGLRIAEIPVSSRGFFLPDNKDDKVRLEVRDGKVRITGNDCSGQDCVKKGWISPGGFLICAPKRIVVGFSGGRHGLLRYLPGNVDSETY